MPYRPRIVTMGGVALAALAVLSVLTAPLIVSAQGPTRTPTVAAPATDEPTSDATTAATQAVQPTRLPPCPLPAGDTGQTASATETPTKAVTSAATQVGTEETAEATAAATEPPPFEPGYLGIAGEDADSCGTRVVDVLPDSPAEAAGVELGDIITGVGMTAYPGVLALRDYVTTQPVGAELELVVRRNGDELILSVALSARPQAIPATVTPAS